MKIKSIMILLISLFLSQLSWAGNDKSIKGDLRSNIQYSMNLFISENTVDGKLYVYDSVKGNLLKLTLDKLHSGIVKKGDFYVSCADFVDQNSRKIDIDFMVIKNGTKLITTQALVHSIDGNKRKYHLEKS